MTYHIRWWIAYYAVSLFQAKADVLMESLKSGVVYILNTGCKYSAASTVATRSWTVDDFFLCIDHFYIMSTINKPNRFYSMFFTLVCIIYLVFSIFIPNGILYIVFTSATREICCKSHSEIIRLHRPLLYFGRLGWGMLVVSLK